MQIKTASYWAINNGFYDIDTATSDEFVAWQEPDDYESGTWGEVRGVKVWRDESRDCYVAIRCYGNGEQMGEQRGFGKTMLEALQDL